MNKVGSAEALIPLEEGKHLCSTGKTTFNTFKSFIACGFLGLPFAFSKGGLILSATTLPFVAFLSYYCILLLIYTKNHLQESYPSENITTYTSVMTKVYGRVGTIANDTALLISQTGFATVYIIFIAANMHSLVPTVSIPAWSVLALIPAYLLVLVPSLRLLAVSSFIANFALIVSMISITFFFFHRLSEHGSSRNLEDCNFSTYPIFLCQMLYSFEGIGIVVPIEESMRERRKYPFVLAIVMAGLAAFFVLFGATGYVAYGDDVDSVITLELPLNIWTLLLKVLLIVTMYGTYPISTYPVIEILEQKFFLYKGRKVKDPEKWIMKLGFVLTTGVIAVSLPNFGLAMALVGALACIPLMFIFPALLHYRTFLPRMSFFQRFVDLFLAVFGFFSMIVGLGVTLYQAIES